MIIYPYLIQMDQSVQNIQQTNIQQIGAQTNIGAQINIHQHIYPDNQSEPRIVEIMDPTPTTTKLNNEDQSPKENHG